MIDKGVVYLKDPKYLQYISNILKNCESPFLEIGPGKGDITKIIPGERLCVECNLRHIKDLEKENVIWSRIEKVKHLPDVKTCVSNLPYGGGIGILIHCVKSYESIKKYIVILQKEVVDKMINSKSLLHHKMSHLFKIKFLIQLPSSSFNPKPFVNGCLIELIPNQIDWKYIDFLNRIKHPRKILKNNGINSYLRLEQISKEELYQLYIIEKSLN